MVSLIGIFNTDVKYPGIYIKVELIVMRDYLGQMETGINAVCGGYICEEEEKISGKDFHEYQHIYELAENDIPRIIRMPFLVTIFTLFENSVTQLLKYAQEKEKKSNGLKATKGNSLSARFNKYMAQTLDYDFQFDDRTMEKIAEISKIRNCIAHANGNVDSMNSDKAKEINDLVKKNIGVSVAFNQLDISYKYLVNSMGSVSDAIKDLMYFMEIRYGFRKVMDPIGSGVASNTGGR